ncbi:MAG TPA: FRG domain-containing protein, partial [Longimicrobium sp.]|nr:FRG domain-containing protein [Longimicrobium sp.]
MANGGFEDIEEVRIDTLGQLLDLVTPGEHDPVSGRIRDTSVYRGSGHATWPLLTSLDRLGGIERPHTKAHLEEHILRNFIRYSRAFMGAAPANEWELLVAAQHHGVPTRLLDWSYSPLIAAHFATLDRQDHSARAVWRLDWKKVHCAFGFPELALLIQDLDELF